MRGARGELPGKSPSALLATALLLLALPVTVVDDSLAASTLIQSSAAGLANCTLENLTLQDGALVLSSIESAVWRLLSPKSSPSARVEHAMAPVPGTDRVLLFGGWDGSTLLNDTWLFDLSDGGWSLLSPPSAPRGRRGASMAPFDGTDTFILFGGQTSWGVSNYTWLLNLSESNWTRPIPPRSPPARSHHSLSTIPGTDRVLLEPDRVVAAGAAQFRGRQVQEPAPFPDEERLGLRRGAGGSGEGHQFGGQRVAHQELQGLVFRTVACGHDVEAHRVGRRRPSGDGRPRPHREAPGQPGEDPGQDRKRERGGGGLHTYLRSRMSAAFSNRETWAWETPISSATSIWVLPS